MGNNYSHHDGYNSEIDWMKKRRLDLENPIEPDRDAAARARRLQQLEHVNQQIADYNRCQLYYLLAFVCYCLGCCACFFLLAAVSAASNQSRNRKY